MKNIIVPIDFSLYSENAFLSAVLIASRGDVSITCVNAVATDLEWKNLPHKEKIKHQEILDLEAEAMDKLQAFVINHQVQNIQVEAIVRIGIPYDVIVEVAHQQNADLVIIGAYGKGYFEGRFIGSNLQKVIRLADCPVLAVKNQMVKSDLENMVFACLFNELSKPSFEKIKPFIRLSGASVNFLYVNIPENKMDRNKIEKRMENYAMGEEVLGIKRHIYDNNEVEKGIISFCKNNQIGWIGIASNTRKTSSSYQIGVTDTLIFKSEFPILSVKFE